MGDALAQRRSAGGQDAELVAEGELCTALADASTDHDGALSRDEVDRLLGIGTR